MTSLQDLLQRAVDERHGARRRGARRPRRRRRGRRASARSSRTRSSGSPRSRSRSPPPPSCCSSTTGAWRSTIRSRAGCPSSPRPRSCARPQSPLDDVVPAARPITVEDLLTFRAGWGFPSDFSLPAVVELFQKLPVFGAARDAGRVARDARAGADAPPARRGVALQHVLRHPGRAGRARRRAAAAGVPRRAHLRAARDERHRLLRPGRRSSTGCRRTTRSSGSPIDDGLWTEPPVFPSGCRRARLDARRLAPLRPHAARRRRRAPLAASRCA